MKGFALPIEGAGFSFAVKPTARRKELAAGDAVNLADVNDTKPRRRSAIDKRNKCSSGYNLQKEQGAEINPQEFAVPAPAPLPPAPWEVENEEESGDGLPAALR